MNKIKSRLVVFLIFMLTFVTGYSASNEIKVGMECGYAPFNWFQDTNKNGAVPTNGGYCGGYDVEIAKVIAKKLGKKISNSKNRMGCFIRSSIDIRES